MNVCLIFVYLHFGKSVLFWKCAVKNGNREHFLYLSDKYISGEKQLICKQKTDKEKMKGNLDTPVMQKATIYNDGDLAFLDDLSDLKLDSMVQNEIFVIALCLQGKASLHIDSVPYVAYPNDIFICPPNVIINDCLLSVDFKCYCIGMTLSYIQEIVPMADCNWDVRLWFQNHPHASLSPHDAEEFCRYYELLCYKASHSYVNQKKVIDALMLAFVYDMQNVMEKIVRINPRPFTSGEQLFKNFIELLSSSYPKNRRVEFYADRLHVTSKYLSSVCKKIGKKTASQFIDQAVLKDIEYLMKHSSKSIKEITAELDFPSLSFFGKYVKKHLGLSPKAYREQAIYDTFPLTEDEQTV